MTSDKQHFLVVGSGLAGCCISLQLLEKGAEVSLLDSGENFSSSVAAGLINPLVFRRMTKSWRLDEFLPYLEQFYTHLERETESSFFHALRIRRIFAHAQERDFWLKRQDTAEFEAYMDVLTAEDEAYPAMHNVYGTGRIKKAAFVDVERFLQVAKDFIAKRGTLTRETLDYSGLSGTDYKGKKYDGIVFCEGFQGKANPWFGYLPLGQTKGETLTIRSKDIPEDESLNLKCFVLPKGNSTFKIGSTYVWHNPNTDCTEAGRQELMEKIAWLTDEPYEILEQGAGVRPTTVDRRPFLGVHPEEKNYYIFNGLGTKGYMLAPLLSLELAEFVLEEKPLNPELDIARFPYEKIL